MIYIPGAMLYKLLFIVLCEYMLFKLEEKIICYCFSPPVAKNLGQFLPSCSHG